MTSSGGRSVPFSISLTRSSVGGTIGKPSVQDRVESLGDITRISSSAPYKREHFSAEWKLDYIPEGGSGSAILENTKREDKSATYEKTVSAKWLFRPADICQDLAEAINHDLAYAKAYQDEAIALDLLRWSYLKREPIMGRCVAEALFPCETGLVIPATYFDRFLQDHLGEAPPEKTRERLKSNLKKIGFLERAKGKPDRLLPVVPQKTSFLILIHHLFAAKAVRTVELRNLVTNPFWKYLGYKTEDTLRALLREADAAGLVGKYVVADQLEQVTTCFTLDEFLERRARL